MFSKILTLLHKIKFPTDYNHKLYYNKFNIIRATMVNKFECDIKLLT